MRKSVVLPAPFGPYEPDLLAALERGRSFDEDDLLAILLADILEADHGFPMGLWGSENLRGTCSR